MKILIKQGVSNENSEHIKIVSNVVSFLKANIENLEFFPYKIEEEYKFDQNFQKQTGIVYTPANYRRYRLRLLSIVDALLFIHTSSSDNDTYELSYNLSSINPKPVFFAVWRRYPITNPLLKELDLDYPVTYCQFSQPKELLEGFMDFFQKQSTALSNNIDQELSI